MTNTETMALEALFEGHPRLLELLIRDAPAVEGPLVPRPDRHPGRPIVEQARPLLFRQLGYRPHPGQATFHDSLARFKVLVAGARFGKSLAGAREVLPWLGVPGSRGWIVAPTYRLGEKEFRYLLADAKKLWPDQIKFAVGGVKGPSSIIVNDGGELHVLSAHDPSALLGEELDWLLLSEAAQLEGDVWPRYLRARLTTRGGVLVVPSTPRGYNWLHDLYLRGFEGRDDWQSFHFATGDNPLIPQEEIEEARATMPSHLFDEQYLGKFTAPSGLVYPEFDPTSHVVDTTTIPGLEGQARVGGLDFGYTNPFAFLVAVVLSTGRVVITHEVSGTMIQFPAVIDAMKKVGAESLSRVFCDPSGAAFIRELNHARIKAAAAVNAVSAGIDQVRRRLVRGADGLPMLLIDRGCKRLIEEFSRYQYSELRVNGREASPEKHDDHALDALRYLCMGIAYGPRGWKQVE